MKEKVIAAMLAVCLVAAGIFLINAAQNGGLYAEANYSETGYTEAGYAETDYTEAKHAGAGNDNRAETVRLMEKAGLTYTGTSSFKHVEIPVFEESDEPLAATISLSFIRRPEMETWAIQTVFVELASKNSVVAREDITRFAIPYPSIGLDGVAINKVCLQWNNNVFSAPPHNKPLPPGSLTVEISSYEPYYLSSESQISITITCGVLNDSRVIVIDINSCFDEIRFETR